jgi:hypothetical protein
MVIGEVVGVHVDRAFLKDGIFDKAAARPIARCGYRGDYVEFRRDADEPATVTVEDDRFSVSTARGAISLGVVPGMRAIAYETPGGRAGSWGHAVALCLPSPLAFGHHRQCLTELGHDLDAIRTGDGVATLFDVGLGCAQADLCVHSDGSRRTGD